MPHIGQCKFNASSGKLQKSSLSSSVRGLRAPKGLTLCPASCGTCIPEHAAQQCCWCACLMPSLMDVPCACLLNGPIISMSRVKWNACKSHCCGVNTSESYNITNMQRSYKHLTNMKRCGSYKRWIYLSKLTSFSSTEAIFPAINNWSILEFIKRLVMSTRITIRWLSEGHPRSKWRNSECLSWFTAVTVTGYLCACTWKHQYI